MFLKSHTYALVIFLTLFWCCNCIYTFGRKFQTQFRDPSRVTYERCWFSLELFKKILNNLIRNRISLKPMKKGGLSIILQHSNHATFHFFTISVKNVPYLLFVSHCVEANFNFGPKSIERYNFLRKSMSILMNIWWYVHFWINLKKFFLTVI